MTTKHETVSYNPKKKLTEIRQSLAISCDPSPAKETSPDRFDRFTAQQLQKQEGSGLRLHIENELAADRRT